MQQAVVNTADLLQQGWLAFVNTMTSFPDKMHDTAVSMAAGIRDKVYEYTDALSLEDAAKTDITLVRIQNKAAIDALRQKNPALYARFVQLAGEERLLTDDEIAELTAGVANL